MLTSLRKQNQNWLYLTEDGLALARLQTPASGLPTLDGYDWRADSDVLNQPASLASWAAERASGHINLLLGDGHYQLLLVDAPDVPVDEMENALRLKAAELIGYDIDDATLEVILLPGEAYHGRMRMAFIVAARKTPLRAWALELARHGLTLRTIDVDRLQLRNLALAAQPAGLNGLLHLAASHCWLVLVYQGELVLSRRFDIGYQDLGATDDLTLEDQDNIQRDSLVLELRRSFDYHESQLGLGSITQLGLSGWPGSSDLAQDLGSRLGLRFVPLFPEDLVRLPGDLETALPEPLLPLLGTAFRRGLA